MSKMVNCKACGKEIAKGVNKCVQCGKDQRNFIMKHKILTGVLVVILLVAINTAGGDNEETKDTATAAKPATETSDKVEDKKVENKINYSNFLKIKMGSSYKDAVALIGEGLELSSSEISGIKTAIYTWNGDGISNMNLTIQNNLVMGKAQLALQSVNSKVTLEQYNKVKEGMSYAEVKSTLGEGQIVSQSKIMDMENIMYVWTNNNASNMNCTFISDKMIMKAQINLK